MTSPLIVALDLEYRDRIRTLATALKGHVGMFKIGPVAFTSLGPEIVYELTDTYGAKVFLDLKLHDIPSVVRSAVRSACHMGVSMITVHASGGADMIRAAKDAAPDTQIIAATVLTSDQTCNCEQRVSDLTHLALDNGADGIVCSSWELKALRWFNCIKVVPGIRLGNALKDDQQRTSAPGEAIRAGASWIVVGRPIIQAINPLDVVNQIHEELR